MLFQQYNSQFSKKSKTRRIKYEQINETEESDLSNIDLSDHDIANANNKSKKYSAARPDGITTTFLINTRYSINLPLQIIIRKSMDKKVMHDVFKVGYISPLHKGGLRINTANAMKIFERVIKIHIL